GGELLLFLLRTSTLTRFYPTVGATKSTKRERKERNLIDGLVFAATKCKTASYCSRHCQKAAGRCTGRRAHRSMSRTPRTLAAAPPTPPQNPTSPAVLPSKGFDAGVIKPFTRLKSKTLLHARSEKDTFRILIN